MEYVEYDLIWICTIKMATKTAADDMSLFRQLLWKNLYKFTFDGYYHYY